MAANEALAVLMFVSFIALVFSGFPVAWLLGGLAVIFSALAIVLQVDFNLPIALDWSYTSLSVERIWNVMENQEVIDFVREKISKGISLLETAAALCDACLSDGSDGDGTGCDNESVVLLQLNKKSIPAKGEQCNSPRVVSGGPPSSLKRRNDNSAVSSSSPESSEKRQRKSQG